MLASGELVHVRSDLSVHAPDRDPAAAGAPGPRSRPTTRTSTPDRDGSSSSRPMRFLRCAGYGHAVSREYLAKGASRGPHLFGGRQWSAAIVLIACAQLATLVLAVGPYPHDRGQRLFLALVVCAPILLLRRWPLPLLAAAAAANALVMALGNPPMPFAIMLGLALYFVASRLPRRVSIRAAVATAVTLGAALVYAALAVRTVSPAAEAVEGFLPSAAEVRRRQRGGAAALPGRIRPTGRARASRRGVARPPGGPRGAGAHRS